MAPAVPKFAVLSMIKTTSIDRRHFVDGLGIHQQVVSEV